MPVIACVSVCLSVYVRQNEHMIDYMSASSPPSCFICGQQSRENRSMADRLRIRNPSHKSGKKGKTSPTADSPKESREKKYYFTGIQKSCIPRDETGSNPESNSEPATTTSDSSKQKTTIMMMSDIANFAVILQQALQDQKPPTLSGICLSP